MPNLTNKKTKTINSNNLIKNQINLLFQPVNGVVQITPQQPTNKILTQNAIASNYYVPLLQTITGEQTINTRSILSFNSTTNTLNVSNLTLSNPPICNVDASNSYDLVKKSYANTYCYFDLSAGDRWYCEDWITNQAKGSFNWELSTTSGIFMNNPIANHIGILTLYSQGNNNKSVSLPITYNTSKLKTMRFIVSLANGRNADFRIGIFDNKVATSSTKNIGFRIISVSANDGNLNMFAVNDNSQPYAFTSSLTAGIWVLLEIRKYSNNISYSVKNLTSNITYSTYSTTISNDFDGYIAMYFNSGTATANSRYAYIDYIDWIVSS